MNAISMQTFQYNTLDAIQLRSFMPSSIFICHTHHQHVACPASHSLLYITDQKLMTFIINVLLTNIIRRSAFQFTKIWWNFHLCRCDDCYRG